MADQKILAALDDAAETMEYLADHLDLDISKPCPHEKLDDDPLCEDEICHAVGCVVRRARDLRAVATEAGCPVPIDQHFGTGPIAPTGDPQ